MKPHRCLAFFMALLMLPLMACAESKMPRRPDMAAEVIHDPPYDFDPDAMLPRDFGPYFEGSHPTSRETYKLLEGTQWENSVLTLKGAEDGPTVYIIAGVHGGEIAAWSAGNLIKKADIKAGKLHILSPANPWGAAREPRTRYVTGEEDLNRSFPGNPAGNAASQVAHAIFQDVKAVHPVFVFDLHEAATNVEGRDFLGNSLIYTTLEGIDALYLDLLLETQMGGLTAAPFDFFSPGPKGSVNNTIANQLNIPVITTETYRGNDMAQRISDQLAIVQYVLRHYGLVD